MQGKGELRLERNIEGAKRKGEEDEEGKLERKVGS